MPAGEWGSEGISNLCCPGRPAAVCSTARGEMSSHLEEIRMENIHVKNKRIKIAIQKKKEKLCLLRNMYSPCPELMLLKAHGIYTRSRMPTLRAPRSWQSPHRASSHSVCSDPTNLLQLLQFDCTERTVLPQCCSRSLEMFPMPFLHFTSSLRKRSLRASIFITLQEESNA